MASNVKGSVLNDWTADYAQKFHDNHLHYAFMEMWFKDGSKFSNETSGQCQDFVYEGLWDLKEKHGV